MTQLNEREAILQCQSGDMAGLESLFKLHRLAVLRTAYGIVSDVHLAEDVTQQVFVELFTAIRRFDPERSFAPWLYRIVVNISLKEIRRREHRRFAQDRLAAELPSADPLPDLIAEELEVRRIVWKAMLALSPKQRAAVALRYYRGFSEAEMAVALGCRKGTVKSRLHNALRKLESLLREDQEREGVTEHGPDSQTSSDLAQR